MRYLIVLLAIAGIVVSVLALKVHYDTGSEPCSINEKWDCGVVNHSPYAMIGGVPVAAIGIVGYLLIGVLGFTRRRGPAAGVRADWSRIRFVFDEHRGPCSGSVVSLLRHLARNYCRAYAAHGGVVRVGKISEQACVTGSFIWLWPGSTSVYDVSFH